MVFSYHYKYERYLRQNKLLDPRVAREKAIQAAKEAEKKTNTVNDKKDDGEDLSAIDDDASQSNNQYGIGSGKYRFDTLIKTMIARIEYNNTLAPV